MSADFDIYFDSLLADIKHLRTENASLEAENERVGQENSELVQENLRLRRWIDDLQSGMYVNCVYCGHRYGPGETTPVSMADALKAHVEQCPKHPMSALKAENAKLKETLDERVKTGAIGEERQA